MTYQGRVRTKQTLAARNTLLVPCIHNPGFGKSTHCVSTLGNAWKLTFYNGPQRCKKTGWRARCRG